MGPERAPASGIEVQVATRSVNVPRGADFAAWVRAAGASGRGVVTVRLAGWAESRRLNENFRGSPVATNVLAFAAPGQPAGSVAALGDLVICLPLVYREAREQRKKPLQHLAHLVVHGTLHLLGHDHHRAAQARKMEAAEVKILRRLGFPDPYRRTSTSRGPEGGRRKRP